MVKTRSSNAFSTTTTSKVAPAVILEPGPSRPQKRVKIEVEDFVEETDTQRILPPPPAVKRRVKTKAKAKAVTTSAFLPRASSLWKVGAHVSAAGGVENAVMNAAAIGANAFALFLKSQRKWESPPMKDSSVKLFKQRMQDYGYDARYVLPHGSYLINLGNPEKEKRMKSYDCFLDDLKRCEALGLKYYNFHPGSTVGGTTTQGSVKLIAECLNEAHKVTTSIVTVLENMAGAGNIIGSTFKEIRDIIALVEDKTRVGVCFDTCHAHAAGYDISSKAGWDSTMTEFDEEIGLKYLCGMHMNDSKTPLNSKRDRHENIGLGTIGLPAFKNMLNDPRTQNIPLILETPSFERPVEVWGTEIRVLQSLVGTDDSAPPIVEGDFTGHPEAKTETKQTMEELEAEVRAAVKAVDVGPKTKAKALKTEGAKAKAKGGKRKRKDEESEEDEDQNDECDDH